MTQPVTPASFLDELRDIVSTVAVPHHEPPALIRRRRIVVVVVLVIGGALLGYSLTRRPGDASFYWLTLALAAVWALGAFVSGPLHVGSVSFRGRNGATYLHDVAKTDGSGYRRDVGGEI